MNKFKNKIAGLIVLLISFSGCDYNKFDNPEKAEPVQLQVNKTIKELKAMYPGYKNPIVVKDDIIIGGTVISEDREGNVFKSLKLQDNTGGIEVRIGRNGLYNYYKLGQTVYVKCKGLTLGAYGESVNIGAASVNEKYETGYIENALVDDYVFAGPMGEAVVPKVIPISPVPSTELDNTLVRLENVQFLRSECIDSELTWADPVNDQTLERHLEDAAGNQIIVRTSGYARFAGSKLPKGGGSVTAILTFYRGTPQLTIVRLDDVKLDGPRIK